MRKTNNFIQKIVKKRRCAGTGYKDKQSAVRNQCKKCTVGLCTDCFENFYWSNDKLMLIIY